jgi:hypothetical protein
MSEEARARRSYGFWVAAGVALAPMLYVWSVGPAAYLVERTDTGRVVADIAYGPLIWLHRNTPLRKPINAYITTCARAGASAREKH